MALPQDEDGEPVAAAVETHLDLVAQARADDPVLARRTVPAGPVGAEPASAGPPSGRSAPTEPLDLHSTEAAPSEPAEPADERRDETAEAPGAAAARDFAAADPSPEEGASPPASGPEDNRFEALPADLAEQWIHRAERLAREAAARGETPSSARLYVEIGRIEEEKLGRPRQAAAAYQTAFNLDAAAPVVLHASRRLFTEFGEWAMVVQFIGYEAQQASTPERKATMLAEQGALLESVLRDSKEAERAYRGALEENPLERSALYALERMYREARRYDDLSEIYGRALAAAPNGPRALELALADARLAEDRLDRPALAIARYEAVLAAAPEHPEAIHGLRRLYQRQSDHEGLFRIWLRTAQVATDRADAARSKVIAARMALEQLDRPEEAAALAVEAEALAPRDFELLEEVERILRRTGDDVSARATLARALEADAPVDLRSAAGVRLASELERAGDLDAATESARSARALDPSSRAAARALGCLLERTGRLTELAELYREEIEQEDDLGERVAFRFRLAELEAFGLADPEAALSTLRALLAEDRGYGPARRLLERLLALRGDSLALVELYEEEAELTTDPELSAFLLARVGVLAEEKLGDVDRAARALRRLLEQAPKHLGAIRTLARFADAAGDHVELLRLLELETDATDDLAEVLAIMHRRATLLLDRGGDEAAAAELLERLLSLNPTYLPALQSLGRIHAQRGEWRQLVDMHRRELEVTRGARRQAELWHRIAKLEEDRLGDLEAARRAYAEALELEPEHPFARRALAEIAERLDDLPALVRVRLEEAERRRDPASKAAGLLEVARLCEERLDRGDQAVELFQRVVRLGHSVDAATRGLVRIHAREGMWNALAATLTASAERASSPEERAATLVEAADVDAERLKNLDHAAERLEEAVRLDPSAGRLARLEQIMLARRDFARALEIGERLADTETDPATRAARFLRLAQLAEHQVEPPRSGVDYLRKALDAVPDHPVAIRALESAYLAARDWAGLAHLYEREASVPGCDPARRADLLHRAADIHAEQLLDGERAAALLDEALAAQPSDLPSMQARRRLAEAAGDVDRCLALLDQEARETADPSLGAQLLFEAGRVHLEQRRDRDAAIAAFEAVLSREPLHLGAFNQLEALYLEREEHDRVYQLLRLRASMAPPEEQARLRSSAGRVAEERLADPATAMEDYAAALALEPKLVTALVRYGPLLLARGAHEEAVEIFQRTLAATKEPEVLRDTFKSLATLYQLRGDLFRSVQSLQAALTADPSDIESLERLAELYEGAKDWGSTVNVLLKLVSVEPDPQRRTEALLRVADIEVNRKDQGAALRALRKAVELDPGCRPALERLCDLHEARQEWPELVEVARHLVNLLGTNERSAATRHHRRMAEVFEYRLRDEHRAAVALQYVLEAHPDDVGALERLAGLLGKRAESYRPAIEVHRRLLALDPLRIDSYRELHRLFRLLEAWDPAFIAAEVLVFLQAHRPEEFAFHAEHKASVAPITDGALTDEDHESFVVHPDERGPIRRAFSLLGPELGRAASRTPGPRTQKLNPRSSHPVRVLVDELSHALSVPGIELWLGADDEFGVRVEGQRLPAVVVGGRFAKRVAAREQRFLLGRALERVKGGQFSFDGVSDRELEALVWAVAQLGRPSQSVPVDPAALDMATRRIKQAASGRIRKELEEAGRSIHHVDMGRHRVAARDTAHRAGLLVSGELEAALRVLLRERGATRSTFTDPSDASMALRDVPEALDLLSYSVSDAYFAGRARLKMGVQLV